MTKAKASGPYTARIFVDGIDRKKAIELTNALRLPGVSLERVRSRRDESEPLIRPADMWAGCIRGAQEGGVEEQELVARAMQAKYLRPRLFSRCRKTNLCQAGRPSPRPLFHRKTPT